MTPPRIPTPKGMGFYGGNFYKNMGKIENFFLWLGPHLALVLALFVMPGMIITSTMESSTAKIVSTQNTIQLTEPIQQNNLSYVAISKNNSEARYINNSGEEIAIPLAKNCRIFHKNGKQNKISCKITKKYNYFNEKIYEKATRVTIYKMPIQ